MSTLKSCRSNLRDGRASGVTFSEQDAEVHAERLGVSGLTRPSMRRPRVVKEAVCLVNGIGFLCWSPPLFNRPLRRSLGR